VSVRVFRYGNFLLDFDKIWYWISVIKFKIMDIWNVTSSDMNKERAGSSEMLVNMYHTAECYNF
jgi:hypothetical protein